MKEEKERGKIADRELKGISRHLIARDKSECNLKAMARLSKER